MHSDNSIVEASVEDLELYYLEIKGTGLMPQQRSQLSAVFIHQLTCGNQFLELFLGKYGVAGRIGLETGYGSCRPLVSWYGMLACGYK